MNFRNRYYNCFSISEKIYIFVFGNIQIVYTDRITYLHLAYINRNFVSKGGWQCSVTDFLQKKLKDSFCYLIVVYKNNFCYGMYFFSLYKGLEINFIYLAFHGIVINFFYQYIHGLSVHI